jgi:hypothetical protein
VMEYLFHTHELQHQLEFNGTILKAMIDLNVAKLGVSIIIII